MKIMADTSRSDDGLRRNRWDLSRLKFLAFFFGAVVGASIFAGYEFIESSLDDKVDSPYVKVKIIDESSGHVSFSDRLATTIRCISMIMSGEKECANYDPRKLASFRAQLTVSANPWQW